MAIYGWLLGVLKEQFVSVTARIIVSRTTLIIESISIYLRPTLSMVTPWSWLKFLSSPPCGLFDSAMERESVFLGTLSRIYRSEVSSIAAQDEERFSTLDAHPTFGSKDVNWSVGLTVNLNCPSLLWNRRRMEFDEGILLKYCGCCGHQDASWSFIPKLRMQSIAIRFAVFIIKPWRCFLTVTRFGRIRWTKQLVHTSEVAAAKTTGVYRASFLCFSLPLTIRSGEILRRSDNMWPLLEILLWLIVMIPFVTQIWLDWNFNLVIGNIVVLFRDIQAFIN